MPSRHQSALRAVALLTLGAALGSCNRLRTPGSPATPSAATQISANPPASRPLRTVGTIAAQKALTILVPRISGQGGPITLTALIASGVQVKAGDVVAEFDSTAQVKAERDAQAKFDDLSHQVDQKIADARSNAAKRSTELVQAQADLD